MGRERSRALFAYAKARSALYAVEGLFLPAVEAIVTKKRPRLVTDDRREFEASQKALDRLLLEDVKRIDAGVYPVDVLKPRSAAEHVRRMPELLREGFALSRRRQERNSKEFGDEAQDLLADVPEYYRRNFHFQRDGYLSERSARLYEHQVEVLFGGGADAMRRLIIEPMKRRLKTQDGEGLRLLEIGAGTGRTTRFVRLALPKARIVALDVSAPYLKLARESLHEFSRVDFIEGLGEQLPFQDGLFDACYSVFLYHELPRTAREGVIAESMRVLKPGGFFGLVDSVQTGDVPEFDEALERFPVDFHEPFYRDYVTRPIEDLARNAGVGDVKTEIGFFSKCVYGAKAMATPKAARARKKPKAKA